MTEEEKRASDSEAEARASDEESGVGPSSSDTENATSDTMDKGPEPDTGEEASDPGGEQTVPEGSEDQDAGQSSGQDGDPGDVEQLDTPSSGEPPEDEKKIEDPVEEEKIAPPSSGDDKKIDEPLAGSTEEEQVSQDPLEGYPLDNRFDMVKALIGKHGDLQRKYSEELQGMDIKPPELVEEKEVEKLRRDSINEEVQKLKTKRKELKDSNKSLRAEFFDLLDKEEKLREHRKEVEMYSQFSRDLEWKLETEAIDIEIERRLLDELRETMDKMRSLSDGFTPDEIKNRLNEIQEQMGENLMRIEEHHRQMLERVGESNVHHNRFMDVQRQLKEKESRRGWLKRRIELHDEMEKFWSGQVDQSRKLDEEDSARSLERIRDQLLDMFKEREGKKEEEKEQETPDKVPPRSRKKDRPRRSRDGDKRPPRIEQKNPSTVESEGTGVPRPEARPVEQEKVGSAEEKENGPNGEDPPVSGPDEKGADA